MTLRIRTLMGFFLILALTGIGQSPCAFAQAEKLQTSIFLIGVQRPIVIQDFTINNAYFYDAVREGKQVKLFFRDLKEIKFLNPGMNNEVEVAFNDGRKETYDLRPASDITMHSALSDVSLHHSKVARIAFSLLPAQPPPAEAPPIFKPPQTGVQPGGFDRVALKNGDILSGYVQTTMFPVRTAYGTFQFETGKIASIEFDEKGPNTAVVLLRNGDRLNGTVEVNPVLFVMTSGQGISFDGKTIKTITFKR
ncbi:MAG: hypothetical protein JW828_14260 [Sedimentisphaerales bacterium]|nr:hypothetical protein [Sedimentisphaerales bacterium]